MFTCLLSRTCCCQTVAGKIFFDNAPTPVTRSSMRGGRHPSPTRGNNTHYHISLSYTITFNREGGWAQEHSGETRIRSDHHRDRGETTVRWKMRARRDHRGDYNCHGFGEISGNFRLAICMQPHLIRLARSEGSRQGSCVCLPCERDTREIVSRYDHYDSLIISSRHLQHQSSNRRQTRFRYTPCGRRLVLQAPTRKKHLKYGRRDQLARPPRRPLPFRR